MQDDVSYSFFLSVRWGKGGQDVVGEFGYVEILSTNRLNSDGTKRRLVRPQCSDSICLKLITCDGGG